MVGHPVDKPTRTGLKVSVHTWIHSACEFWVSRNGSGCNLHFGSNKYTRFNTSWTKRFIQPTELSTNTDTSVRGPDLALKRIFDDKDLDSRQQGYINRQDTPASLVPFSLTLLQTAFIFD